MNFSIFNFLNDYISSFATNFRGGALTDGTVNTNIDNLDFGAVIRNYFDTPNDNENILNLRLKSSKETEFFKDQIEIVNLMANAIQSKILDKKPAPILPKKDDDVKVRDLGVISSAKSLKEIVHPILLIAMTSNTTGKSAGSTLVNKLESNVLDITVEDFNNYTNSDINFPDISSKINNQLLRTQFGLVINSFKLDLPKEILRTQILLVINSKSL